MWLETIADSIEVAGHLLIAFTALQVHQRVRKEHRITKRVYREMHRERLAGISGIALIVIGFIIRVYVDYGNQMSA